MNRIYLQLWVHMERAVGILPDGCSLHMDLIERDKFVSNIYNTRSGVDVPDEYERCFDSTIQVYISDSLYESLSKNNNIRLDETSFRNLLNIEDIIMKSF